MNLKYMYIKLPEENYLTKEILLEPIKHNNNNLRGIISTSNIPDVPGVIKEFGLSGLEKFLDFYYEHNIDDTFNQSEEKIMEIYRGYQRFQILDINMLIIYLIFLFIILK